MERCAVLEPCLAGAPALQASFDECLNAKNALQSRFDGDKQKCVQVSWDAAAVDLPL